MGSGSRFRVRAHGMGLGSRFRVRACSGHGLGHTIGLGFRVRACDRRSARGAWEHEDRS